MPNWSLPFITNSKEGSVKQVQHHPLTFNDLWNAYPEGKVPHIDPKSGKDTMDNHCAIRVSDALYHCGVKLKSFKGVKCWCCPTPDENGKGIHAIRAQQLADYLKQRPFAGCPNAISVSPTSFQEELAGKTGIIFFKDYWVRSGQTQRTGDHIDLWNENELAGSGAVGSFFRANFGGFIEERLPFLSLSDFHKSTEVLFWEIK